MAWITRISCICPESLCSVLLTTHLGPGLPACAGSHFCLVNLQMSPRQLLGVTAPPQHRRVHLSSFCLICHSRPGGCEVSHSTVTLHPNDTRGGASSERFGIHASPPGKCPLRSSAHFNRWSLCLHTFWTGDPDQTCGLHVPAPILWACLHFLGRILECTHSPNFGGLKCSSFSFCCLCFWCR